METTSSDQPGDVIPAMGGFQKRRCNNVSCRVDVFQSVNSGHMSLMVCPVCLLPGALIA